MSHQTVIVLDFGGQYNQLIARRVRECGVYCEVKPYTTPLADIRAMNPIGIIFTGGPNSVYDPKSPQVKISGSTLGEEGKYTLLGPPVKMMPMGFMAFSSDRGVV